MSISAQQAGELALRYLRPKVEVRWPDAELTIVSIEDAGDQWRVQTELKPPLGARVRAFPGVRPQLVDKSTGTVRQ